MHDEKKFTDIFIDELSVNFPEKALKLLGLYFVEQTLIDYINENEITPENFSVGSFKYYLTLLPFKNQTIQASNVVPVGVVGSIYFDTSTNTLKIFDGNQWMQITN